MDYISYAIGAVAQIGFALGALRQDLVYLCVSLGTLIHWCLREDHMDHLTVSF